MGEDLLLLLFSFYFLIQISEFGHLSILPLELNFFFIGLMNELPGLSECKLAL
jgi:hypothetical protein